MMHKFLHYSLFWSRLFKKFLNLDIRKGWLDSISLSWTFPLMIFLILNTKLLKFRVGFFNDGGSDAVEVFHEIVVLEVPNYMNLKAFQ